MMFLAPIWLVGLLPWAAVALYLLWGRRRQVAVPFLDLWLGPERGQQRRKLAAPPLALAAALLAMLLALLAASRPRVAGRGGGGRVVVLIDRGAGMSAKGGSAPRFAETANRVAEALRNRRVEQVEVRCIPARDTVQVRADELPAVALAMPRTAVDTGAAVRAAANELARAREPSVVLTDRDLGSPTGSVVQVAPEAKASNAGIALLAVRESPAAQAMVRVHDDTAPKIAGLEISTAGQTIRTTVDLPSGGQTRDVFVDLPRLGDVVSARLLVDDAFDADDTAWLVRGRSWPRVESRADMGPELARMIEVYSKSRPAGEGSATVAITRESDPSGPAVILAPADLPAEVAGAVEVIAHPATRNLAEAAFHLPSLRLAERAPSGWTPIVRLDGRTAVAIREQPVRQVWVGFDSPDWSRRPEFVVFWANLFDWVGGVGGPEWRAESVGRLEGQWRRVDGNETGGEPGLWPGLYEHAADGARRAVNAGEVVFPTPPDTSDWKARLAAVLARAGPGSDLAPFFLVASLAGLAVAALSWRGRRRGPEGNGAAASSAGLNESAPRPLADVMS